MILNIENPKDSTQNLPELISKFRKVAGYKSNIQESVAFLYTNNEILEKEYKNTIPFKIVPQNIKYLGVNLSKRVPKIYMLRSVKHESRKLKTTQRNGKIFHAPGLEKLTL